MFKGKYKPKFLQHNNNQPQTQHSTRMRDNALPLHNTKRPIIMAMFSGPGPACVGRMAKGSGPKYSFGLKPGKSTNSASPGPAAYRIQEKSTRFGNDGSPKYTLHYRTKEGNGFTTPGPGKYHKIFRYFS